MNDSRSWAQGSKYYEQLKVMDDMSYIGSWAQLGHELNHVDAMNALGLWMIQMT